MRISVVTISFNQAAFLPACLRSVAAQRSEGDEHICVDPGSTDGSREVLRASESVRCVFEKDDGPADGLNNGFAMATGDVFGFINADDEVSPGAFSYVRDFFRTNPDVDIVIGAVRVIDAAGRAEARKRVSSAPSLAAIAGGSQAFYQQGMFFRRRVWAELGVRFNVRNRTCWDYEFLADALKAGARAEAVARELGRFRLHADSITGSGRTNDEYARDRARIQAGAGSIVPAGVGAGVRRFVTKLDPARRLAELLSWGDAPEFSDTDGAVVRRSMVRVVIAWQELPFYARRCIAMFVRRYPDIAVTVITSGLIGEREAAEQACGCRVCLIDSERAATFAEIGVSRPDHLFATSWSHAAYRALGDEVSRAGGAVTLLADNNFLGTPRQWAGAVYFRAHLAARYHSVWVPGKSGERFMETMGVSRGRIFTGLYAADDAVFYPPIEAAERRDVVYAGQLIARKRVCELWKMWRAVASGESLAMIGEGPLRGELLAQEAPVEPGLGADGLAARFRAASALILVSAVDHWGLVVHEAALCGCLILITRTCGAADDLVVHRENGYVMEDLSESELRDALMWMRGLTAHQEAEGRARSVALAKQFSPARWADRAYQIIHASVREGSRAAI